MITWDPNPWLLAPRFFSEPQVWDALMCDTLKFAFRSKNISVNRIQGSCLFQALFCWGNLWMAKMTALKHSWHFIVQSSQISQDTLSLTSQCPPIVSTSSSPSWILSNKALWRWGNALERVGLHMVKWVFGGVQFPCKEFIHICSIWFSLVIS